MDAKTTGIVAYLTWIGFIIAICAGDKDGAIFHVNQALVIMLFHCLQLFPVWAGSGGSLCWYAGSWDWLQQSTRKKRKFR